MVILNYLTYSFVSNLGDTPYIVVGKQIRFCRYLAKGWLRDWLFLGTTYYGQAILRDGGDYTQGNEYI